MRMICFALRAAALGVVVMLSSCATEEKPAIVRQVEMAGTPVQAFVIAIKHLNAVTASLERRAGMITSTMQLNAASRSLVDAFQGFTAAGERMLKMDSMTDAEADELNKVLPLYSQAERRAEKISKILMHKAEKYLDESTRLGANDGLYWISRMDAMMEKLLKKGFDSRE